MTDHPDAPASRADVFEKALSFDRARQAREAGFYPYFLPLESNEGSEAIYQGRRILMFGSNNYLGLTTHPKVREAARRAISELGTSCTGSRFLNGTLEMHLELERQLAEFVGKEAALVFSTGMQTNLGTISALIGRSDTVFLDKDDHASIVDAARLGWGRIKRFRHNDLGDLERQLLSTADDRGRLVVVDGLYSMEGDLAPLPQILDLSHRYGARVMVDDAHGIGVMGAGRGTAAHFGVVDETDLIMSTFSKSFASLGGFIAGDAQVVDFIQHHARALIFSASIPPPNAAAALAALEIMRTEPERVERLQRNGERWRTGLQSLGFDTGNSVSPIVPVIVGDDMVTFGMWRMLLDEGVYTNPVVSPATPNGRQLLRTSCMATHTNDQIDRALEAFEKIGKLANLI
ncbi:MAG TPA: pyridoxal phosphate-dependent aminotransferase family protein [Actinobacteria bacterium]|nr:putative pyridoxal phosphate-dependent acyltransferase [bacterium BMS3Bbin01]HDH27399.1 pyridoxal phosphate-dependent aminotransferase family protein [Actinomycetota bacterium]